MKFNKRKDKKESEIEQKREKEGDGESKTELWFSLHNWYNPVDQKGAVGKQKFKSFLIQIFFRLAFG